MPLFEIGYRRYEGVRTSHATRWWPITRTGIAIAWRSKLLKRLVFVSFLPFLYFGWVFFVIGRITDPGSDPSGPFYALALDVFGPRMVAQMEQDPSLVRTAVWSGTFAAFGTMFQLWMVGLVAAITGPPQVANDLRSRAFLIYFARPVSRVDYVVGKVGILVALLAAVTLLPSLALYVVSILFSPSLETVAQTLPVAGSMVLATLGTIVPASLVVLALSSLARQPRFAAAIWFVLCLFGPLAHEILQQTRGLRDSGWTFLLSLPHTVRTLQLGLYDVEGRIGQLEAQRDLRGMLESLSNEYSPVRAALWLAAISVFCVLLLLRRVDAPTRA